MSTSRKMRAEPGMISLHLKLLHHKYSFCIIEGRREAAFFYIFHSSPSILC